MAFPSPSTSHSYTKHIPFNPARQGPAVTIGADGLGLISYFDVTNANLKAAHCSNTNCTSATITALDTGGNVGPESGITIGTDGLGLISYLDVTNLDLKVAHCANQFCSPYLRRR